MPEFSEADKAQIADYVNARLAKGDAFSDINRDLRTHWAQMDASAEAAVTAQAATQPEPLPAYAPLPSGYVTGSGQPPADATATAGPLSREGVEAMLAAGRPYREVAALVHKHGIGQYVRR